MKIAIASFLMLLWASHLATVADAATADYTTQFTCTLNNTSTQQQSPIDITPITCSNIAIFNLNFFSATGTWSFENTFWYDYQWTPSNTEGYFGTLQAVASDYGVDNYQAQWLQLKIPSEHTIRETLYPLELQIYFKSTNATRNDAIFSFFLNRSGYPGMAYTQNYIRTYFDASEQTVIEGGTSVEIDLTDLSNRVNQYPLFYRYPGTSTTPGPSCKAITWYIYSSPVYVTNDTIIENFETAIEYYATNNPTVLNLKSTTDPQDLAQIYSNAQSPNTINVNFNTDLIERFCYKEFWRNHIPFNYGIWFALGMLVLFFCCQLCTNTSKPIRDRDYVESPWTIHPVYSLKKVSNEIFTRRTRFTVVWMNFTNNAIITSIFAANNKKLKGVNDGIVGPDIFLYALAGSAMGGTFTYIWGFLLRSYYISKHRLLKEKDKGEQSDAKKIEKHEEDANFYLYLFYFITFAWMWGGNLIFVWQMNHINPIDRIGVLGMQNLQMSVRWMASFFISIGLDWFVLDLIHVILAFIIPPYRRLVKWKGFMYDSICHETWLLYSKED